jgi:hypothetical protein
MIEVIGTGRIHEVIIRPLLEHRCWSNQERFSVSAIEMMRLLFAYPHIDRLEAVAIPSFNALTEQAKEVWRELAPSSFRPLWQEE